MVSAIYLFSHFFRNYAINEPLAGILDWLPDYIDNFTLNYFIDVFDAFGLFIIIHSKEGGAKVQIRTDTPGKFPSQEMNHEYCLGGDLTLCSDETAWKASIRTQPGLVRFQALPLSEFQAVAEKKSTLEEALYIYLSNHSIPNSCPTCAQGSCSGPLQVINLYR